MLSVVWQQIQRERNRRIVAVNWFQGKTVLRLPAETSNPSTARKPPALPRDLDILSAIVTTDLPPLITRLVRQFFVRKNKLR